MDFTEGNDMDKSVTISVGDTAYKLEPTLKFLMASAKVLDAKTFDDLSHTLAKGVDIDKSGDLLRAAFEGNDMDVPDNLCLVPMSVGVVVPVELIRNGLSDDGKQSKKKPRKTPVAKK